MDNNPKNLSDAAAMAQFRLALIVPVIHGLCPDASRNACCQRITENPPTLPDEPFPPWRCPPFLL